MLDHPAGRHQGGPQCVPSCRIPGPLLIGVDVVREGSDHRRLNGGRHQHPGMPAYLEQRGDQLRITGHQAGPVPGHI